MSENRIRGLVGGDDRAFNPSATEKMLDAQQELQYLLSRDYAIKAAMTFVGNHHQLTVRQALAVTRSTASPNSLALRKAKQLSSRDIQGRTLHIDGFNLIITLEVVLSNGMLFVGQDGCIRDLAELRGTYRLIPQTDDAIALIRDGVARLGAKSVAIYLDQPVSNSGRLKERIYDIEWPVPVDVDIVRDPDAVLKTLPCVVSGDSVILDECKSWFNMVPYILEEFDLYGGLIRLIKLNGGDYA